MFYIAVKLLGGIKGPGPKEVNKCGNTYHQVYNHFDHRDISLYTPKQLIYFGVNGMGQLMAAGVT